MPVHFTALHRIDMPVEPHHRFHAAMPERDAERIHRSTAGIHAVENIARLNHRRVDVFRIPLKTEFRDKQQFGRRGTGDRGARAPQATGFRHRIKSVAAFQRLSRRSHQIGHIKADMGNTKRTHGVAVKIKPRDIIRFLD